MLSMAGTYINEEPDELRNKKKRRTRSRLDDDYYEHDDYDNYVNYDDDGEDIEEDLSYTQ